MKIELALVAALLAAPAWATDEQARQADQDQTQQTEPRRADGNTTEKKKKKAAKAAAKESRDRTAQKDGAKAKQDGADDIKGYGYGEQPGQESNAGAGQATKPGKAKSDAPQDERGAAASRAAEREGSELASDPDATAAESGKSATPRKEPGDGADYKPGSTSPTGTNTGSGGDAGTTSGSGTTGDAKR